MLLCLNIAQGQTQNPKSERTVAVEKIVVKGKRARYNRHNPAVELAKRLAAQKDSLNIFARYPYVGYERYEKIVLSIDNFKAVDSTKSLAFLNDHTMVNPITGKTILPISLKEKIVATERHKTPKVEKFTPIFERNEGLDDRFSQGTVLAFLNDAIPEIDLFGNSVYLVQRHFIGPFSAGATDFYKFFLHPDTIIHNNERCVVLEFFPFSKNSLSLRGKFIVGVDSSRAPFIFEADVSMPNSADVNFVSNLNIRQQFDRDSNGMRVLVVDDVSFDFSPIKRTSALNVRRINNLSDYSFTPPDAFANDSTPPAPREPQITVGKFKPTEQELLVARLTKRMRRMPLYAIAEEITLIATEGYFQTGKNSVFDIGPVAQFLSGNTLEGTRLAVGGITTPNLSKHIFADVLFAYGFTDHKFKYNASVEWSFRPVKEHFKEFPINSLRATYSYDVHRFGERFDHLNSENIFSWAKRASDYNLTYVRLAQLRYMREFAFNFSYSLYARHYTEYESPVMSFAPVAGVFPQFTMAELELRLRYAPGEKIYQTRRRRRSLDKYIPTFELSHVSGFKGILGSDFVRNHTELSGFGRINIQPLGYIDIDVSLGAEWNQVPYMLLPHPKTNMSYLMGGDNSFSLMNPLEYLYDRYAYVGVSYYLDGLILSRIPLIKHLSLREVFTFRGVWGALSSKNNPQYNPQLLPFPEGAAPIGREPYMEVGVGIDNILSLFRIDYVWRITYLDKPYVQREALLVSFTLKF